MGRLRQAKQTKAYALVAVELFVAAKRKLAVVIVGCLSSVTRSGKQSLSDGPVVYAQIV